jgi:hypothetical protein
MFAAPLDLRDTIMHKAALIFFTTVVKGRECLFGNIMSGEMILNNVGGMIQTVWDQLPEYYPGIHPDIFQIMPNHLHCIIIINNIKSGAKNGVGATPLVALLVLVRHQGNHGGLPLRCHYLTLSIDSKQ